MMHQHVPQSSLVSRIGFHEQTVGKQTGYLTNLSPPPQQHSNRIHLKPQPQSPQNCSHHHTQSQGSSRNTNAAQRLSRLAGSAAPRGKHGCLERIEGKQRMQARCNKKWKWPLPSLLQSAPPAESHTTAKRGTRKEHRGPSHSTKLQSHGWQEEVWGGRGRAGEDRGAP